MGAFMKSDSRFAICIYLIPKTDTIIQFSASHAKAVIIISTGLKCTAHYKIILAIIWPRD